MRAENVYTVQATINLICPERRRVTCIFVETDSLQQLRQENSYLYKTAILKCNLNQISNQHFRLDFLSCPLRVSLAEKGLQKRESLWSRWGVEWLGDNEGTN